MEGKAKTGMKEATVVSWKNTINYWIGTHSTNPFHLCRSDFFLVGPKRRHAADLFFVVVISTPHLLSRGVCDKNVRLMLPKCNSTPTTCVAQTFPQHASHSVGEVIAVHDKPEGHHLFNVETGDGVMYSVEAKQTGAEKGYKDRREVG